MNDLIRDQNKTKFPFEEYAEEKLKMREIIEKQFGEDYKACASIKEKEDLIKKFNHQLNKFQIKHVKSCEYPPIVHIKNLFGNHKLVIQNYVGMPVISEYGLGIYSGYIYIKPSVWADGPSGNIPSIKTHNEPNYKMCVFTAWGIGAINYEEKLEINCDHNYIFTKTRYGKYMKNQILEFECICNRCGDQIRCVSPYKDKYIEININ